MVTGEQEPQLSPPSYGRDNPKAPPSPKVAPSRGQATYGGGNPKTPPSPEYGGDNLNVAPPSPESAESRGQNGYGRDKTKAPPSPEKAPSHGQKTYGRGNRKTPPLPEVDGGNKADLNSPTRYGRVDPRTPPSPDPTLSAKKHLSFSLYNFSLSTFLSRSRTRTHHSESHLMMGNSRRNEKDKPPASVNPLIQLNNDYTKSIAPNMHSVSGVSFREGNVAGGRFESVPDMPVAPGWENVCSMNQSIAQGIPETSGKPMGYFMNPNSLKNSQINLISNTANTDLPEVPLLPEWNMRWSPQFVNQEHDAISAGGMNDGSGISSFENPWSSKSPATARNFAGDSQMSRQGGESKFSPFNRPQINADVVGSPLPFGARDTATVHTRNNINFNTSQSGVQGKVEGSFLSLGIGGTEETITRSQTGAREISHVLKEAASAELKIARARRAMGQTLDAGFMGLQRNISGFSNQSCHVDRMTSTNNEVGMQCTLNSGPGSSPYHTLQMQHGISRHDDGNSNFLSSRNIRYGDLDHYRAFVGNQAAHSGTLGGNSAQFFNSQQYDLNGLAPESSKPSWIMSHTPSGQPQNIPFTTVNSLPSESSMNSPSLGLGSCSTRQNYAGKQGQQLLSHNGMSTQGLGGSLFPQRIAAPQVAWVSSGQAATDAPFPKRLGVELNGKDSPQVAERHLSPRGTNLQTTSTGAACQFPDKGSTYLPDHLLRRSIDRTDGTPINCPLNSQEPFSAHGQSQDPLIQLPKDPRGAASTNASTVDGLSQKSDFHTRPYHKRTAVAPPPASHWVQRQKITHPTNHHSVPIPFPTKPATPVTTALVHPSIPVASQRKLGTPVSAPIHSSIPGTSHFKSRVPVTTAPIVAHIAWKDPDGTPRLTGHKCLLCKRDLSLTSEGAVYQPVPPPPVAVLPCGHTFHDQCLQNITPQDQSKDPPCIPCAIGDN
ncbi:hypothetical protein L6452_33592 [Arctium lappa]|uniref:Uncharacterized protein n=1 Tax=Arctium lappa TaxID=4217 RepID=A0ACB8YHD8_ARCLA|nr:hypothetical protein L6452_33592 [Arctium lappa]